MNNEKLTVDSYQLSTNTYALYKDSGVEWLGQVPEHWQIKRIKDELSSLDYKRIPLSGEVRGKMTTQIYDYYGASGIIDKVEDYIFDEPLILIGEDGANLLMRNSPLAFIARGKYWVNNHAHILKPRKGNLHYLCYLLESFDYTIYISGSAQPKLTAGQLNNIFLMSPPLPEQAAIADYLDQKTAQIDHEIDLLSKKTALYSNLKQSLINETVTRGLDKNVALKHSGVEWLGQVPEHWQVKRLKDFCDVNPVTKVSQRLSKDELIEFIPMTNIDELSGTVRKFNYNTLKNIISGYTQFRNNDIIFAKITPCMENGNCAIVSGLTYNLGFGSTEFLVYRPYKNTTSEYLHYFLHNKLFRLNAEPFMKGSAGQKRISNFYISTHCFPCPPLSEQTAIADYLDQKTAQIDNMVSAIGRKIATLQELRKTLINDVVTGQIKVF